jgi:uncharacterized membrane protein YbhN (UPF0104 family)
MRVVVAALTVLCCWLTLKAPDSPMVKVATTLHPPPQGVAWLVTAVWWAGSIGVIVVLAGLALLARRRDVARDVAIAAVGTWLVVVLLQALWGTDGGRAPSTALVGFDLGFPLARIAATVAVAATALPLLSRPVQRAVRTVIVLAAVATVVHGSGTPVAVLASLALGWGTGAAVHLIFGSPLGLPSGDEAAVLLADAGVPAEDVVALPRQPWGVARYRGRDDQGPLEATIYGRDAADAQLLAKTFRFVCYRDSGPQLTLTRIQQVEHEAYLTLVAERSGARVPAVVTAGRAGPSRDAVLVTRPPVGTRLADLMAEVAPPPTVADDPAPAEETKPDGGAKKEAAEEAPPAGDPVVPLPQVGDDCLRDLFSEVAALRRAGLAHGAIGSETVVVDPSGGRAGLVDFRCATATAPAERLDRDVAAALAVAGTVAGADRAVAAAATVLDKPTLAAALPYLQRAALDPTAARPLRGHKHLLAALRDRGAAEAGVEVPKLAEPRRISWINLVVVIGSFIGIWALVGVFIQVGSSFSTIVGADWGWVVATAILCFAAYPANAVTVLGSVVDALPYGPAVTLEVSNSFVSLAAGTMGAMASRVRFFQQAGYDATLAISSGALVSTASWIVKGALFLIALPIALSDFHFTTSPSSGSSGSSTHVFWLIILVVVGVVVLLGLVLFVPRLRRLARDKLRPKLSEMVAHLKVLAVHPRNLVEVFGGSMAAQLVIALALGTALHAFNEHLNLAELLIVLTLASMLGGVSPVPGGMGIVEAGMILGLTAAGIPETQAVAATFVQRLFSAYLPPVAGWISLVWMRRHEYL